MSEEEIPLSQHDQLAMAIAHGWNLKCLSFLLLPRAPTTTFLQNEPTGDGAGQDSRIEPAGDNAARNPQDQSTADFRDPWNEPTDLEHDFQNEPTDLEQDRQNEPTAEDRDLREERRHRTVDERLPGKRMEWFQTMAHYKRVEEENLRKRQERNQKRMDGNGIGTSAHPARASPAGLDA